MAIIDPIEQAILKEEAEEAEAEGSSMGSPRRPHDAPPPVASSFVPPPPSTANDGGGDGDEEEEEEEEDVAVLLDDSRPRFDPEKAARIRAILSTFTEEQMKRYEAFRRSGFCKSKLKKVMTTILGNHRVSEETNIVVSALAKMFVGDLVETARVVMTERNETGPIRPCHIKEAYRRVKLEGKTFKRTVSRLFH